MAMSIRNFQTASLELMAWRKTNLRSSSSKSSGLALSVGRGNRFLSARTTYLNAGKKRLKRGPSCSLSEATYDADLQCSHRALRQTGSSQFTTNCARANTHSMFRSLNAAQSTSPMVAGSHLRLSTPREYADEQWRLFRRRLGYLSCTTGRLTELGKMSGESFARTPSAPSLPQHFAPAVAMTEAAGANQGTADTSSQNVGCVVRGLEIDRRERNQQ